MTDAEEIAALRREICELRVRIAELEADRQVLILEVESLDKLRKADVKRLASLRSLDS
jgi:hypothetical protein